MHLLPVSRVLVSHRQRRVENRQIVGGEQQPQRYRPKHDPVQRQPIGHFVRCPQKDETHKRHDRVLGDGDKAEQNADQPQPAQIRLLVDHAPEKIEAGKCAERGKLMLKQDVAVGESRR